jgi:hypothetical protein
MKAIADEQQRIEEQQALARAFAAAHGEYVKLLQRQAQEAAIADERHVQGLATKEMGRTNEIESLEKAIARLENLKKAPVPRLTGPWIARPRSTGGERRPTSPDTIRSLCDYRKLKDHAKLKLPALNLRDVLAPVLTKSPSESQSRSQSQSQSRSQSQLLQQRTTKRFRPLRL